MLFAVAHVRLVIVFIVFKNWEIIFQYSISHCSKKYFMVCIIYNGPFTCICRWGIKRMWMNKTNLQILIGFPIHALLPWILWCIIDDVWGLRYDDESILAGLFLSYLSGHIFTFLIWPLDLEKLFSVISRKACSSIAKKFGKQ